MDDISNILKLVTNGGIVGVLVFVVYSLIRIVKYLSKELKDEIKSNDVKIVELYEGRLADKDKYINDIREEYDSQFEHCSKCNILKFNKNESTSS